MAFSDTLKKEIPAENCVGFPFDIVSYLYIHGLYYCAGDGETVALLSE